MSEQDWLQLVRDWGWLSGPSVVVIYWVVKVCRWLNSTEEKVWSVTGNRIMYALENRISLGLGINEVIIGDLHCHSSGTCQLGCKGGYQHVQLPNWEKKCIGRVVNRLLTERDHKVYVTTLDESLR